MAGTDDLRNMVMTFRVSELQMLLGFAGRNKSGRKNELQSRAVELLRLKSTPIQMKIRELYKSIQQGLSSGQQTVEGIPGQVVSQNPATAPVNTSLTTTSMMNPQHQRAASLMNCPQTNPPGYPQYQPAPSRNTLFTPPGIYTHFQPKSTPTPPLGGYPIHPDVKLKKLPFYDHLGELLKPSSLLPNGTSRIQEQTFVFHLTPQQATDIAMNRDTALGAKTDYVVQVQMRFCLLETSCEQEDCFPPGIVVKLNNKMCPLPNPIPTNKPGVDPRRPPRPVNVSHLVRLSPTVANLICVSWAAEFGRGYVIAVNLVRKLSSAQLLMRLKSRGIRHADYTTGLIKEKLSEDADSEIATTSLRVSLLCPLGKMRMTTPCRPCTCTHLQCFDASLYLQMNERKPTWMCPVCDKPATFDKLVIDGYFQDVLQSGRLLPEHSEIQLHQDGSWSTMSVKKEQSRTVSPTVVSKVEAATVEISDEPEVVSVGDEPKAGGESKKKAIVIDLTSDSEDETPAMAKKSNSISSKPDSTAKNSDTSSTVSTTGRSSVTSPGYISPNIITLDSPSPPTTPIPTTPPALPLHSTLPSHIPHIDTPHPTYSAPSLPLLEIDSDSNSPMYQHQRY